MLSHRLPHLLQRRQSQQLRAGRAAQSESVRFVSLGLKPASLARSEWNMTGVLTPMDALRAHVSSACPCSERGTTVCPSVTCGPGQQRVEREDTDANGCPKCPRVECLPSASPTTVLTEPSDAARATTCGGAVVLLAIASIVYI